MIDGTNVQVFENQTTMSDAREALEALGCLLEWYWIDRFEKHAVICSPEDSIFAINGKSVLTIDWYKTDDKSECPQYVFWNHVINTAQTQLKKIDYNQAQDCIINSALI